MHFRKRYGLYNYVDTPDLTMNELVGLVRKKIKGKNNVGFRLPYSIGLVFGVLADFFKYNGQESVSEFN